MKKQIKIVIAIFALIIGIVFSWHLKAKEAAYNKLKIEKENINRENEIALQENVEKLEKLKKKFNFKQDEFKGDGWYTHLQAGDVSWNRIYLSTPVNSSGYIYLISHYYASDWLFHTKVMAKVGERVIETEDIPLYSDDHDSDNNSGSIYEINHYTRNRDNGIIKLIAENYDKEIKVRFVGKYYRDMVLSEQNKIAIKESYDLSDLIKKAK